MRVVMTIDAVGGVWRYGVDLARHLGEAGIACLLVGCGPEPSAAQQEDCRGLNNVALRWSGLPLDWMVADAAALADVPRTLLTMVRDWRADLLHLNLPSQAVGVADGIPVVAASHSCLATWWRAVKVGELPRDWRWQQELTGRGLRRADVIMVPTISHGAATTEVYGSLAQLEIVPNATNPQISHYAKQPFVLAAGRWWDEGKNAALADAAAALSHWPVRLAGALNGPNGSPGALRHAEILGPLSSGAMQEQMSRAGIFFSPALYEPFGLAVLEAAAHGCALVLADIPTFRELWTDAALFVAASDSAGFSAAINHLADHPTEREILAQRAIARAAEFTYARQVEGIQRVYAKALATSRIAA
jgi:glycosyltransferase involved in cell wall biosynthesis